MRAKLSIEDKLQALTPIVGKYIQYLDTDNFDDTTLGNRTEEELRACVKARKLIARVHPSLTSLVLCQPLLTLMQCTPFAALQQGLGSSVKACGWRDERRRCAQRMESVHAELVSGWQRSEFEGQAS